MPVDLINKSFVAFGLRGTGKSTLINYIAGEFGSKCLVYDILGEVPADVKYHSYTPRDRYSLVELGGIVRQITGGKTGYRAFIIDEANRFCPPKPAPLPPFIADLNDQLRHYGCSVGYTARRPTQLHQDLTELANYLFCFHLKGKNDIQYLNDLTSGLGDAVLALKNWQFIVVYPDRSYELFDPIEPDEKWLRRAKQLEKA